MVWDDILEIVLYENMVTLKDHFSRKWFRIKRNHSKLIFSGIRPVVLKAAIKTLIKRGRMTKGRVVQYEDRVEYSPDKKKTFYYQELTDMD